MRRDCHAIKEGQSNSRTEVGTVQDPLDDSTLSLEDKDAIAAYLIEKKNGTLLPDKELQDHRTS